MSKYRIRAENTNGTEGFSSQLFGSKALCSLYGAKLLRQGWKVYMERDIAEDISLESRRKLKAYANYPKKGNSK